MLSVLMWNLVLSELEQKLQQVLEKVITKYSTVVLNIK